MYVSRFITPPLPGESTSLVQPGSAGGEVVAVSAAGMTVSGMITLRHSDVPDFEIQGSGMPNYLGAVALSPDGATAWVPSKQDNVQARHAAQWREPQLPEHGARHRLAHRPGDRRRRPCLARRPRQLQPRQRRGVRYLRQLPVRGAGNQPRSRGASMRRAATKSSASTSAARRRAWRSRTMACVCTSTTSWIARVGVFDLTRLLNLGESNVPSLATLNRRRRRVAVGTGAQGQAVLLRRARHAPVARRLPELRLLSQRRRPRRAHLGSHRHGRGSAQHRRACEVARPGRASCTGPPTSTSCRTSKPRSARWPAARA